MPPKSIPSLAIATDSKREARAWIEPLRAAAPELRVELLDALDPDEVDYGAVWGPAGGLQGCRNLKAIVSLGAGVDHILREPALGHLPIVRMIDPGLTHAMSEFALLQVLHHHRGMVELGARQRRHEWKQHLAPLAADRTVGIMGLGVLGRDAARHIRAVGFRVTGWSRTARRVPGIRTAAGADALPRFLARAEILVCLLPLTAETRGIMNAALFARLPKGAAVINLARGAHVIESDLVAALDSGHLSGASLDVFEREPLPRDNPLWSHPKVVVTPHVASLTRIDTGSLFVARAVRSLIAGKRPRGLVDRRRGY
jgi:glyoxylate/hydroxypyruvate reductase A